jgi:hypothetical protein
MGRPLSAVELDARSLFLEPQTATTRCFEPVVCVPARDEARRLPALIGALDRQVPCGSRRLRVLLLLNNSKDSSRLAAEHAALDAPHIDLRIEERWLPKSIAHAGSARRAAMESGAAWLEADGVVGGVILTTDADATPAHDWVSASCSALEAGADVAAAAIRGAPAEEARFTSALRTAIAEVALAQSLACQLEDAIDPSPGDPAPRHTDNTGGGLALRLETYRAVGGCPALPVREDLALVHAVRRMGGTIRHCPSIRVTVSARMRGRAAGGMAATIRSWSQQVARGGDLLAPDPDEQMRHWRTRALLRAGIEKDVGALPAGLAPRVIAAMLASSCPDPVDWTLQIPAREAVQKLESYLDDLVRTRSAA